MSSTIFTNKEILNRFARINDFSNNIILFKKAILLKNFGYSGMFKPLNYDCIYKWSILLYIYDILKNDRSNPTFLDIGGGASPIHFLLSKYGKVYNLDLSFDGWFETKNKYFIHATQDFINEMEKYSDNRIYIKGNIDLTINKLEENSIDYIFDGCSITHMLKSLTNKNLINTLGKIVKKNGYLIMVSDTAIPHIGPEHPEFFYPKKLVSFVEENSTFKLYGDSDYDNLDNKIFKIRYEKNKRDSRITEKFYNKPDDELIKMFYRRRRGGVITYVWPSIFIFKNIK